LMTWYNRVRYLPRVMRVSQVEISGAEALHAALRPGEALAFPSTKPGKPLSDMTLAAVLTRLAIPATVHGFRSTFRDWAGEMTAYPHEVAEMALAHVISNKAEAAYRRGDLFAKRARMMEDWAAFCALPAEGSKVVGMNTQRKAGTS